jgi:hypothetical protein
MESGTTTFYIKVFGETHHSSYSILRGARHLKFIIQILGRTLPTNYRLNLVHSKIYRENPACYVKRTTRVSNTYFIKCSHFHDSRLAIKKETIKISFDAISKMDTKDMRYGASKPNLAIITEQITKFFFPPRDLLPKDYRMLAGFPVFSKSG